MSNKLLELESYRKLTLLVASLAPKMSDTDAVTHALHLFKDNETNQKRGRMKLRDLGILSHFGGDEINYARLTECTELILNEYH